MRAFCNTRIDFHMEKTAVGKKSAYSLTHSFTEIMQRYCILVILSTLGMLDHTHLIWQHQPIENFDVHLHKKTTSFPTISWDIAKILQTCYFEHFRHDWPCPLILIVSSCREVWCLLHAKNQLHSSVLSWDIARILWTCYFHNFGHAWLTTKNEGINLQKTLTLIFMLQIKFIPQLFLEILPRYYKLLGLDTLGMPGHNHQK